MGNIKKAAMLIHENCKRLGNDCEKCELFFEDVTGECVVCYDYPSEWALDALDEKRENAD